MSDVPTALTPESIREPIFRHFQALVSRLLTNLMQEKATDLQAAFARYGGEPLVRWWKTEEDTLALRALPGSHVSPVSKLLTKVLNGTSDLSQTIGLHFLVRRGEEPVFVYFCPSPAQLEKEGNGYQAPYCFPAACEGFQLKHGTPEPLMRGLSGIEVPDASTDKIGSHLAISQGVCQYIPDFFDRRVRDEIPYPELDLLTGNRCSVYLPLSNALGTLENKNALPEVFNTPSGQIDVMLVVQSAIPNLFGARPITSIPHETYTRCYGAGEVTCDADFFCGLLLGMFSQNHAVQIAELVRYGQTLSQISRLSTEIARDVRLDESQRIGHGQRHVWPIVRDIYNRLAEGEDCSSEDIWLGGVMLDVLALTSDLGLGRLPWDRVVGESKGGRLIDRFRRSCKMLPPPADIFEQANERVIAFHCDDCRRNAPDGHVPVRDSVLAALISQLLVNAVTHGMVPEGPAPTLVWGCLHGLTEFVADFVVVSNRGGGWEVRAMDVGSRAQLHMHGTFVGVMDSTSPPLSGFSSGHRRGHRGLEQLLKVVTVVHENAGPACVGFASIHQAMRDVIRTSPGAEHFKKVTFIVFPKAQR